MSCAAWFACQAQGQARRAQRAAVGQAHAPRPVGERRALRPHAQAQRGGRQRRDQRIGQPLQTAAQRDEQAIARAARGGGGRLLPRARAQAEDHRTVLAFEVEELRHGRRQAELFRIGGVDAADQRLRDALQRLAAQAAAHELRQRFFIVSVASWQQQVSGGAQLARPGQQRRTQERPQLRRRQQVQPVRHRDQPLPRAIRLDRASGAVPGVRPTSRAPRSAASPPAWSTGCCPARVRRRSCRVC